MRLSISASSCINPGIFSTTLSEKENTPSDTGDFQLGQIDYQAHIAARQLRRLSKVAKMGIYCAKDCMAQ